MKVLIIHGEKPTKTAALHPAFKERLELALSLDKSNRYDLILLSGGQTRKQFPAESEIGLNYLKDKTHAKIILESKSKTTIENIKFSKEILHQYPIEQLDIITSQTRLHRTKYLYKNLWLKVIPITNFYGAKDYYPKFYSIAEFIYLVYEYFDINELFLPKLTKFIFRNG